MIVRPVLCRPFVGRAEELAYLRERRLEAGGSHGGLVLIAGDAGVGKSRLLSEFCTSLAYSRWRIGRGSCIEFAARPYGAIIEAFAKLDAAPLDLGAAASKREQLDAIAERLAAAAARTAVIIAIEDLHWADAATLDVLAYLGPRLGQMRALVVASVREEALHAGHPAADAIARIARGARAGRIDLAPLAGTELTTFIDEALDGLALPQDVRRAVAIAGEGNPYFTEELLKSAVEQASASGAGRARALPQTVRATLLERLAPFDESERRVIAQAAVIGRTFDVGLLAATLDAEPEALLPALRHARDLQLVEERSPSVFRFRHGLTRDAIYADFLGAEARPRHNAIAQALEAAPEPQRDVEALAYHWWAAGDAVRAATYNEQAGDAAASVHAHEDAIAFYERALETAAGAPARAALLQKVASRRLATGATKEAQATFAAAADAFGAAGAYEREASSRATAAIVAYGTGQPDPTAPLEAMLARLDASEYLARSRVHLGLAWLYATFGFPTRATEHLAQVDPRAAAEARDIALRLHNVAAFAAMTRGDLDGFRREFPLWVEAAAGSGPQVLAGAHVNGAMCCAFFGLHEDAQEHVDRALRLARQARSRHTEETVHAFAALCAFTRGDLEATRAALAHVSPASESRVNVTFATAWGSLAGAAMADDRLVERWFDDFEAQLAARPDVECGAGFAELLARRGRARDAAEFLHRALPDCELLRGNVFTLVAVARHGTKADRIKARAYLEKGANAPADVPERPGLLLFDALVLARDARAAEATAPAREAAEGFRRLRMPLLEAAALEAAGDVEGAIALYRRCGAAYDVRRLAGAPREPGGEPLSDREREIAALAARGRQNLEIARELSITHKTVEKHLASAYRKLGITSRGQLGDAVGRE